MVKTALFIAGLLCGLSLGIGLGMLHHVPVHQALLSSLSGEPVQVVRCATEVNTTNWKTYRDTSLAFAVQYPPTYTVTKQDDRILLSSSGSTDTPENIVFEKFRSPLQKAITPDMREASWKITDRQVYALTTPYFNNEDDPNLLSEIYLFVRDFPTTASDTYSMIRATVSMSAHNEFLRAAASGSGRELDPEMTLNVPEQILSTFRFLQYDELPGRDTGRVHID
jgi:hypothetical protein